MIFGEVYEDGELLYRTTSVRLFKGSLNLHRLDQEDERLISNHGPHFDVLFPRVDFCSDERQGNFDLKGHNTLGQVTFVSGAWARDGTQSFNCSSISGRFRYDDRGLNIEMNVALGEPLLSTFSNRSPARSSKKYSIYIVVPFSDLMEFYDIKDPGVRDFSRKQMEVLFGSAAAESTRIHD